MGQIQPLWRNCPQIYWIR